MRKSFGPRPWLFPMPVLIVGSYDGEGDPDVMTAVWGGLIGEDRVALCLDSGHSTVRNILERRAFTLGVADVENIAACDYAGIESACDVPDKFARTGFTAVASERVDAPVIAEAPVALECEMISYDAESGLLQGRIVNVTARRDVLNAEGEIDQGRFRPLVYDPTQMVYRTTGEPVGRAFFEGLPLRG